MADDAPRFGYVTREDLALFTDLYELTMLQGYRASGHEPRASFSLYFRDLPGDRGYVVATGLEQIAHYLEELAFTEGALEYLADEGFDDDFCDWLADLEFTGDVDAVPEGTPVFPHEPALEITAPITQAQLFETLVINQFCHQSLVATKAARMRDVVDRYGDGQDLVDFGTRRAHGTDAGVKAARACYVGGFAGTSNVAAGRAFDVPVVGTMAHSWVQSFPGERAAFDAFVEVYGEDAILLVDTYDTMAGVERALDAAEEAGVTIRGVRLDSGDLAALSREVADRLPEDVGVYVSSGVDEGFLVEFFDDGGVAAGFGPGTSVVTSEDAPLLDAVYKLVAVERDGAMEPTTKLSEGKLSYPARKDVHRVRDGGEARYDVLGRRGEELPGESLLEPLYRDGDRVRELTDLDGIRERRARAVAALPEDVRAVEEPAAYDVRVSAGLEAVTDELARDLRDADGGR